MLHLQHSAYLSLHFPSSFSINYKHKNPIFLYGFKVLGDNELLSFKQSRKNGDLGSLNAVEKDSGFEVDPDKAREALRKLDEQFQSISNKQVNSPKIRASDVSQSRPIEKEGSSVFSGPFLSYVASGLLVFTIFYNVIFATVIKPSIDGPQPAPYEETQDGAPRKLLLRGREFPDGQ